MTTQPTSSWWPWQRDWWVAPLLVVEIAGGIGSNHGHTTVHLVLAAVLSAAAAAVLLGWRRWPEETLLANAIVVCAYFATGQDNGPILFTPPIAVFLAARSRPPRRGMPWVVAAIVLGIVGLVLRAALWNEPGGAGLTRFDWSGGQAFGQSIVTVAVLLAAAALGANMRSRDQAHAERVRRAATEEQLRMAQDLHDGVGHGLAVIAMQAGVGLHVLDRDPAKARESLEAIRETSRESLAALRAELSRLAPGEGEQAPRTAANDISDLPALVDRVRAGGLEVSLDDRSGAVAGEVGATAYLVIQEALTNVLRHSGGRSATVRLVPDGAALVVTVTDDGQGGAVSEGMGLRGMRARVEALGGTLQVGPVAGGFAVRAQIPVDRR